MKSLITDGLIEEIMDTNYNFEKENKMDAYKVLAERLGWVGSKRFHQILQFLMTPKQAQIVALLPASFEEMGSKLELDIKETRKEIDILFRKGVVIPKNFHTLEGARFARTTMQLHDATQADQNTEKIYGERAAKLWDLWEDFCQNEYYPKMAHYYEERMVPSERVIPAYKAIQDISDVSPYDDVREIIKAAPLMAIVPCACRRQAKATNVAVDICLQFGRSAEYAITRRSGQEADYSKALEAIDRAEDDGGVHMWANWRTLNYGVMCHCLKDHCLAWTPLVQHGISVAKRATKSRFEAVVDTELCKGCQTCVGRCQFDAIEMVKPAGSKKSKAMVNPEKCWGCGVCVLKCKSGALSLRLVRPLNHIPEERGELLPSPPI